MYTMLDQRRRRWPPLYKCYTNVFVFAGDSRYQPLYLPLNNNLNLFGPKFNKSNVSNFWSFKIVGQDSETPLQVG